MPNPNPTKQAGNPIILLDPTGVPVQHGDEFVAPKYQAVTLNSGSGTSPVQLLQAPSGLFYFLKMIQITLDPIATIAAAGMVGINLTDSVDGVIASLRAYIPSAAGSPNVPTVIRQTNAPGFFYQPSTQGSILTASVTTALTGGSARVSIGYGTTSLVAGNNA